MSKIAYRQFILGGSTVRVHSPLLVSRLDEVTHRFIINFLFDSPTAGGANLSISEAKPLEGFILG
jgi:hypothetical protein